MLLLVVLSSIAFFWAIPPSWLISQARNLRKTLLQERQLGLRPYFLEVRADQILGWRKEADSPLAPVDQIRISEYVTESVGMFGDRSPFTRYECLNAAPGRFGVRVKSGWAKYQEGTTSLPVIPLWRSLTAAKVQRINERSALATTSKPQYFAWSDDRPI